MCCVCMYILDQVYSNMERLKEGQEISPQKGCFAGSVHEKLRPG